MIGGQGGGASGLGCAAADDEAVAAVVAQILVLVVLDDGFADSLAQEPGAIDVLVHVEGAFVDADIGVFVEFLQGDFGFGLIELKSTSNL